jgi:adenosylcobinamide-GDP ribazoletransferase
MREALGFLTVLGRSATPTSRALRWFPVVGAAVGALVGAVWWGAAEIFPGLLAAALAVTADLVITGMLHADGVADAADGLLPHATRERRLEIMRTPDVGAFGIAALGGVLLVRVAAFEGTTPDVALIAGIWCATRTVVAIAPAWLPYARESGIASALLTERVARWPLLALAPATALGVVGLGAPGAVAVGAGIAAAAGVLLLARRRIGGFTGDVLGAAIVVGETTALVVAAARW